MAKPNTSTAPATGVDLFGNSTLTPRQLMQKQLSSLLKETATQTAGQDPRNQGASMMGAAAGGLLNQALTNAGVLEKSPEVVRAEKMAAARDAITKDAQEKGLDPVKTPTEFADLAASHFLRAGDEQSALMAINWRNLQEANKRTADLERAKIGEAQASELEKLKAYTPESVQKYKTSGNYADLVLDPNAASKGRGDYFVPVSTADGVKAFDSRKGVLTDPATGKPISSAVVDTKSDPVLKGKMDFAGEVGKKGGENLFAQRQLAMDASQSLIGIGEARKLLDEGMSSGKFANFTVGLGTTLNSLGISYKKDPVENAQAFGAAQAKQVASIIKAFGSGTGLSDADREFATKAAGGDITMNEGSIRKILDINERAALNVIKNYEDIKGQVDKKYTPYSLDLPKRPEAPASAAKLPSGWSVKVKTK